MRFDAASAECLVFTRAEGLLAAFAHDLKLRVTRFTVTVDDDTLAVEGRFDAASLRVVGAMDGEAERPQALGDADRRQIEQAIAVEVLDAAHHPEIRFRSSAVVAEGSRLRITGSLALRGRERPIVVAVHPEDGRLVGEVVLHKPDFGIRPYRAMLGALRVRRDVRVRIALALPPSA